MANAIQNDYFVLGNGPEPRRTSLGNTEQHNLVRGGSLTRYWIEKVSCGSPKPLGSPNQTMDENQQDQEEQYPPPSYESALRRMIDGRQQPNMALPIETVLPGSPIYTPAEEERACVSQQADCVAMNTATPTITERASNTSNE